MQTNSDSELKAMSFSTVVYANENISNGTDTELKALDACIAEKKKIVEQLKAGSIAHASLCEQLPETDLSRSIFIHNSQVMKNEVIRIEKEIKEMENKRLGIMKKIEETKIENQLIEINEQIGVREKIVVQLESVADAYLSLSRHSDEKLNEQERALLNLLYYSDYTDYQQNKREFEFNGRTKWERIALVKRMIEMISLNDSDCQENIIDIDRDAWTYEFKIPNYGVIFLNRRKSLELFGYFTWIYGSITYCSSFCASFCAFGRTSLEHLMNNYYAGLSKSRNYLTDKINSFNKILKGMTNLEKIKSKINHKFKQGEIRFKRRRKLNPICF